MADTTTSVQAIFLPESQIQAFVNLYQKNLDEVLTAEEKSNDLSLMASLNFKLAEQMQGFLTMLRSSTATESTPGAMLISFDEIRMLEMEAQSRLFRSESIQQTMAFNLGNVLVTSLDQNRIADDIAHSVQQLTQASSGPDNDDETQEERNPDKVDLEKNDGLYVITSTQQAMDVEQLVGYTNETQTVLNLTRDVRIIGIGQSSARQNSEANRPTSIILYGPPGTGKTTNAQSVAKALNLTYMYVNAENITSMWAGGTQKNLVKIFRRARIAANRYKRKTLLLIDEVDGLIKNRKTASNLSPEEYSRVTTMLQMLTPPLGTDNSQIVCIFTTNNLNNLDTAFVSRSKPVFFGYIVQPTDRAQLLYNILNAYTINIAKNNWQEMANYLSEFVPRDIVNIASAAKSWILSEYEKTQPNSSTNEIDLKQNPGLLFDAAKLMELTQTVSPATPVEQYFDYDPPKYHILQWLNANQNVVQARIAAIFQSRLNG